jgi:hypothetical protein
LRLMIAYCIFIIDVASAIVQCQFMETAKATTGENGNDHHSDNHHRAGIRKS